MTAFSHADELEILQIWEGVTGRAVAGEQATFALIELEPNTVVPEHRHPNEQTGILLRGSLRFSIGDEAKDLTPGSMWIVPGDVPHTVEAGPEGAALVELFSPPRADWAALERKSASPAGL